ncbi:MAG: hypothetical protein MI799_19210 [Desulfobacterales bacterium]|nr:hypothetical protein [Desulfobacterales bacterium]
MPQEISRFRPFIRATSNIRTVRDDMATYRMTNFLPGRSGTYRNYSGDVPHKPSARLKIIVHQLYIKGDD